MKVAIVDYGAGNIENVSRAFEKIEIKAQLVTRPEELGDFSHALIPGVGSFDFGMGMLIQTNLRDAILDLAKTGKPILGICLGMHMLADLGRENRDTPGLGLISGEVKSIANHPDISQNETIPHMGWDKTFSITNSDRSLDAGNDYYFAHSYYFEPEHISSIASHFKLGNGLFAASIAEDNIFGVQFHPEKSGEAGLDVLRSFVKI